MSGREDDTDPWHLKRLVENRDDASVILDPTAPHEERVHILAEVFGRLDWLENAVRDLQSRIDMGRKA